MRLTATKEVSYPVEIADLIGSDFRPLRQLLEARASALMTSPSVDRHLGAQIKRGLEGIDYEYHVLPFDEKHKTLETVQHLCALTHRLGRASALVAIGGGVCSDLTSITAALVRRGLDCIRVPTTLIGQIDAGIGLKNGVNFEGFKSRIGTFHPPSNVLVDPAILRTLPSEHIGNGIAEILKIAMVASADLLDRIDRHLEQLIQSRFQQPREAAVSIIEESIRLMLKELEKNPFEECGTARLADFGHTFSPLIESQAGFNVHHGQAVALDMALSSAIGGLRSTISWTDVERFYSLIARAGLPLECSSLTLDLCNDAVENARSQRGGAANLVVPKGVGAGLFLDAALEPNDLKKGLDKMAEIAKKLSS